MTGFPPHDGIDFFARASNASHCLATRVLSGPASVWWSAANAPLRSDMRAHLRVLGHHKGSCEAIKATANKDKTVVHVVLNSPPALTGLKPADIEAERNEPGNRSTQNYSKRMQRRGG